MNPNEIYRQINGITADLIRIGIVDQQNFPSLKKFNDKITEIYLKDRSYISQALKNIPYTDLYSELIQTKTYNFKMLDGSLIHMLYRFRQNNIESHRLAFFPSPFLEDFRENPEIYLEQSLFAEIVNKNLVPFPLRFDFDTRETSYVEIHHPKSHLTLGQYENCRIPVSAPITPFQFVNFILRHFYNNAYQEFHAEITTFEGAFGLTISDNEKNLLFIQLPN